MALFNWQNGNKTQSAVVTGDGVTVQDAVWEGETPISASNLNSAQEQLVAHIENEINTNIGTETNTWSSSSSYSVGDRVKYAGGVYENLTGSNQSAPNIDTTNWKLIPIVDNNGHINEKDIYSTTEVKTNEIWIDGKPIYRKTFVFDNTAISTSGSRLGTIPDMDTWVDTGLRIGPKNTGKSAGWYGYLTASTYSGIQISNGNVDLFGKCGDTNCYCMVHIYYTKTTD